ncbi:MAG: MltR family transcriptional regulator [Planctomycetota bacterium]|jgi:DNA-binding MltR family transcriptional regulator
MAIKSLTVTEDDRNTRRNELFDALSRESDRGLVLVSAAFLDESLEDVLCSKFSMAHKKPKSVIEPLFNTFGPLSTFSAKIKISYAMDPIKKWTYQDLEILRKLRNEFAHSIKPAVFDSPGVVRLTEKLVGADHAVTAIEDKKAGKEKTVKKKTTNKSRKKESKEDMERLAIQSGNDSFLYWRSFT